MILVAGIPGAWGLGCRAAQFSHQGQRLKVIEADALIVEQQRNPLTIRVKRSIQNALRFPHILAPGANIQAPGVVGVLQQADLFFRGVNNNEVSTAGLVLKLTNQLAIGEEE